MAKASLPGLTRNWTRHTQDKLTTMNHSAVFYLQESEANDADKQRTAIIVGVTIGGIALFAIGFLASRYCKKRGGFKIMKVSREVVCVCTCACVPGQVGVGNLTFSQELHSITYGLIFFLQKVPQDVGNGNSEAIEFRPVQSGAGIYDEVDEVRRTNNKPIYRRPPPKATYTPLTTSYTPLTTSAAPNDDVYAVPDKKKPVQGEEPQGNHHPGISDMRLSDSLLM